MTKKISLWLFYGLLGYMPVHILLSTWIGTSFGILEFTRVAKEGVLAVGAGLALVEALRRGILKELLRDKLIWLIAGFAALNVLMVLIKSTDQDAELLGLAYNVRFLFFFVWAVILTKLFAPKDLLKPAIRVVLVAGAFTVIFGIFQYLLLPDDALKHIGYQRSNGVLPAFFIDDKPDLERIMSTVRDPNSFGSYALIILGITSVWTLWADEAKRKVRFGVFATFTLLAIFWTFSRAAWIGAATVLASVAVMSAFRQRFRLQTYKTPLLIASAAILVIAGGLLYEFRDSYLVQNVILHADDSTVLEDPNELRIRFWRESLEDIAGNPVGSGPGTAGLASIRNDDKTVLNENYYLQTAQELGIIGLLLFLAILFVVAKRLLDLRTKNPAAVALLAALAGLMVTNFLAHIWANEAVAYTWWGLAGSVLYGNSHNKRIKN